MPAAAIAIPAAASLIGGISGAKSQASAQKAQLNSANAASSDAFQSLIGRQGMFGGIDAGSRGFDLGPIWGGLQQGLLGGAGSVLGSLNLSGQVPDSVLSAFSAMSPFLQPNVSPDLGYLNGGRDLAGNAAMQAFQGFAPAQGFVGNALGAAGSLFPQLTSSFQDVRDSTLSNLRSAAAPQEQLAWDKLQNNLFSTGRLGTTGGGIQTEAFAKGLGEADLSRQLAAGQEARNAQASTLSQFSGLVNGAGAGSNILTQAFQNFGSSLGRGLDFSNAGFTNALGLNQTTLGNLQNAFQQTVGMQTLPSTIANSQLGLLANLLTGASGIQGQGLQAFNALLAGGSAAANARIGGNSQVNAVYNNPNFSANPVADAFASFGAGAATPNAFASLANLWQNRKQPLPAGAGQIDWNNPNEYANG